MTNILLWVAIYLFPFIRLATLLRRKTKFSLQKKRQTWIYIIEIYYSSLFFTMLITKFEDNYFWLWNGENQLEVILERFFLSFAIYQLFIIVKRKLDSSAEIDSYTSMKVFCVRLLYLKEHDDIALLKELIEFTRENNVRSNRTMTNEQSLKVFEMIDEISPESEQFSITIQGLIIDLEHLIERESLYWMESFLLKRLK
ncbi:hypothetical protein MXF21_18180 [Enterococcus casseliflavus]|uniref:hypothetical protein n=1 Tax=Enterococcus casseliflavus TaxID=37734 RepID=UPI002DB8FADC|nr:hypothetical protein [Enterococcus casseliflavus]MEB6088044.1 hypothetical protein [Enterococcus casseliflavus]